VSRLIPAAAAALLVALGRLAVAAEPDPTLVHKMGAAEVDWGAGEIRASAGAAADYRLPSPDIARPGAERRARAAAMTGLRAALHALPLGPGRRLSPADVEAAVARARTTRVDYQSNGGAVVTLSLPFAAVERVAADDKPPTRTLAVGAMPLELAPRLVAEGEEASPAWAVYRLGSPPSGPDVVQVRRDREGRLVLPRGERRLLAKLAQEPVLIYVQKILK
jgi:hypothetical protein